MADSKRENDSCRIFTMKKGKCRTCPRLAQCLPKSPEAEQSYRKRITVNLHNEIQEKTKAREKSWEFRLVRGERQWKMEGIFAEAKDNHGLDRARYRGRAKVQIQAYMIAVVQNIKRMMGNGPVAEIGLRLAANAARPIGQTKFGEKLRIFFQIFLNPCFA
ncbi:MAG: transposase [Bacteroidetes bacterium]|nr:transposase [Bacteroidota bacterium]